LLHDNAFPTRRSSDLFLKTLLSIAGKPQSGTVYSVRAATKTHGPAMRFVANPANWDEAILLIPSGESGQQDRFVPVCRIGHKAQDRKSIRLNSSHLAI